MKKIKIYLVGQKYEIELEEEFYNYIIDDINKLNNSDNQIKDLLNLMLSSKSKLSENELKMKKLLKKLEM